ncbi:MAG: DUF99 family protein [Halobacteriales archaeon]|nr:DUF99 family protein [Halobacteriales archaeon]
MALKPESRVVGFDDVPFQRGDPEVPVVGVVMRGGAYVEAVLRTAVGQDGDDATERLAAAVQGYRGRLGLRAILLQNLMVAGFNVADLDALHAATSLPVVAVARGEQDLDAVKAALLSGRIPNGAGKWERIDRVRGRQSVRHGVTVTAVGMPLEEAWDLVRLCTLRGQMPEPLRLAHLIGAGWVLGQSKGS